MSAVDANEALRLFGTPEPAPERRRLSCGPIAFCLCEGALSDIRWNGVEIVRGISYLFRDRDWGTAAARVEGFSMLEGDASLDLRFTLAIRAPEGELRASAHVRVDAAGRLTFDVVAVPDADLLTNRCGFVVLQPVSLAGRALRVEHTGGDSVDTFFPDEISPSQPVQDIRALSYSPTENVRVECRMEAELPCDPAGKFEMEDQRNWSDASFKTYVASLLDPWPYVLVAKQPSTQRVEVTVHAADSVRHSSQSQRGPIRLVQTSGKWMPAIGVGISPGFAGARSEERAALKSLHASWWIVEVTLDDPSAQGRISASLERIGET